MKFFIFPVLLFSIACFTACNYTHHIYIVRHAEKSAEPPADPHLNIEGKVRAEILKGLLKEKNIKAIYSTEKLRSVETATPLSRLTNVSIQYYGNDSLPAFLQEVIRHNKNALIVGHSNTCVTMISSLNLGHSITFIPDNGYDNLFIIKIRHGKAIKLTETKYGATSPPFKKG